ncbi:MAG: hypothetical protein ACLGIR_06455 [Actinomycetes bacterium]
MTRRGESRATGRRAVLGGPVALVLLVVLATAAQAAWAASGTGSHAAVAADLPAPATVTAAASGTTANVSWSAVQTTGGHPATGYVVTRTSGGTTVAAGGTCAGTVTTTSCADPGLAGGTYTYTVVAAIGASWRSPGRTSSSVTVATGTPNFLVELVPTGTKTAGTAFQVRLTARTGTTTDSTYSGARTIVFSGPGTSPSGTAPTYPAGTVTFSSGIATVNVTLTRAETVTLTATEGSRSGGVQVTVQAGTPTALAFTSSMRGTDGNPLPTPSTPVNCSSGSVSLVDNKATFQTRVSRVDGLGNAAVAASSVSVSLTRSGPATGTTPSTLTIAAGSSESSGASPIYQLPAGNPSPTTIQAAAAGSGLTAVSCAIAR